MTIEPYWTIKMNSCDNPNCPHHVKNCDHGYPYPNTIPPVYPINPWKIVWGDVGRIDEIRDKLRENHFDPCDIFKVSHVNMNSSKEGTNE